VIRNNSDVAIDVLVASVTRAGFRNTESSLCVGYKGRASSSTTVKEQDLCRTIRPP
jgi:hypothetical protein